MKNTFFFVMAFSLYGIAFSYGADEPVNWDICSAEIKERCAESVDDKSKHDCLGKVDRAKFSNECLAHFKGLCKQFGKSCGRHRHKHKSKKQS